jgi:hypothetical protein
MTGETLEFNLDRQNSEIDVLSTSSFIGNKVIPLQSIRRGSDRSRMLFLTSWAVSRDVIGNAPPVALLIPGTFVLDVVSMTVRLPMKMINNGRYKKDYKKLMRAINTTRTITVSDSRFRRIERLLQ